MVLERLLQFVRTREFIARLVTFIAFVAAGIGLDFAKELDTVQITNLIMALLGALTVFDPWKVIAIVLEYLGILDNNNQP